MKPTNTIAMPDVSQLLAESGVQDVSDGLGGVSVDSLLQDVTMSNILSSNNGEPVDMSWLLQNEDKIVENIVPQGGQSGSDRSGSDRTAARRKSNALGPSSSATAELPEALKSITGEETWGDLGEAAAKTLITGMATVANPIAGGLVGGLLTAGEDGEITGAEAVNIGEDIALGATGLSLVTNIVEGLGEVSGYYNRQDGIINSIVDVINGDESVSTTAGFMAAGGIMGQLDRTGYDVMPDVIGKQSIYAKDVGTTTKRDRNDRARDRARDFYSGKQGAQSSVGSGVSVGGSMTGQRDPLGRGEPGGPAKSSNSSDRNDRRSGSDRTKERRERGSMSDSSRDKQRESHERRMQ